jgi:glycosyltransferase involved in cell wall biosynthesis
MKDVDFKLIICGKGPDQKRLTKKIGKIGLSDKIEMKGWVEEDEKELLMGSCRFFVMPSLFESFGLAAVEVMSYGRPMICTNVNGLGDTVGGGGITVPPKDPAALADAMNRLLADREERTRLGKAARAQAETFDWKYNIEKIEDVYKKVIG